MTGYRVRASLLFTLIGILSWVPAVALAEGGNDLPKLGQGNCAEDEIKVSGVCVPVTTTTLPSVTTTTESTTTTEGTTTTTTAPTTTTTKAKDKKCDEGEIKVKGTCVPVSTTTTTVVATTTTAVATTTTGGNGNGNNGNGNNGNGNNGNGNNGNGSAPNAGGSAVDPGSGAPAVGLSTIDMGGMDKAMAGAVTVLTGMSDDMDMPKSSHNGLTNALDRLLGPVAPPALVDAVASPVVIVEALFDALTSSGQALIVPAIALLLGFAAPRSTRRTLIDEALDA